LIASVLKQGRLFWRHLAGIVVVLALTGCGPADENFTDCVNQVAGAARQMEACSQIIKDTAGDTDKRGTAYLRRGMGWSAKGNDDSAMADFDQAIGLDPKSADAFNARGFTWFRKGDNDRALADSRGPGEHEQPPARTLGGMRPVGGRRPRRRVRWPRHGLSQ